MHGEEDGVHVVRGQLRNPGSLVFAFAEELVDGVQRRLIVLQGHPSGLPLENDEASVGDA